MWFGNDAVYFACTNGGANQSGQIWKYVPSAFEGQTQEVAQPGSLELFIEPNDSNLVERADNLTVSPWGDLIICEDGDGAQFLDLVTPQGEICKLAKNSLNTDEFAGATFSPDGTTLFVNIQKPGITIAITGPWQLSTSTRSITKPRIPRVSLRDPFPNPFALETEIGYTVQRGQHVEIHIFDAQGTPVKRLQSGYLEVGDYKSLWDGNDDTGHEVASGMYFVQLRTKNTTALRKIIYQ
jgi:secreted PhoX family phosphatase